jgi:RNA polymerase sigma factor (sigma-70 family)
MVSWWRDMIGADPPDTVQPGSARAVDTATWDGSPGPGFFANRPGLVTNEQLVQLLSPMAFATVIDLERLYVRYREDVLLFLARRTADPEVALDLWAETFAQALAGRRRYRGTTEEEARGWLYAIARKQLALYYRRGRTEARATARLNLERVVPQPEVLAIIARRAGLGELRAQLSVALEELSPAVRRAVQLRIVDELAYTDVAEHMGISEQAARARVSRGLLSLARLLHEPTIQKAMTT